MLHAFVPGLDEVVSVRGVEIIERLLEPAGFDEALMPALPVGVVLVAPAVGEIERNGLGPDGVEERTRELDILDLLRHPALRKNPITAPRSHILGPPDKKLSEI